MRKSLFLIGAIAALTLVATAPGNAHASWLSQALHAYFDPGYYGGDAYSGPVYDGYVPPYGVAVVPSYGFGPLYGSSYSYVPYPVPYRYNWYRSGYYRPWYGNPYGVHPWHDGRAVRFHDRVWHDGRGVVHHGVIEHHHR
jgi:hypothetical protein